jgi:hypothetical protein
VNVDEQAQIQLLALSLKELIQSSAMTALDQLFVFLAVIMRSLGEIRCHGGNRITRKDELTPDYAQPWLDAKALPQAIGAQMAYPDLSSRAATTAA